MSSAETAEFLFKQNIEPTDHDLYGIRLHEYYWSVTRAEHEVRLTPHALQLLLDNLTFKGFNEAHAHYVAYLQLLAELDANLDNLQKEYDSFGEIESKTFGVQNLSFSISSTLKNLYFLKDSMQIDANIWKRLLDEIADENDL